MKNVLFTTTLLLISFISTCLAVENDLGIKIFTDAKKYSKDSPIKITLQNNSQNVVFSHVTSMTPAFSITAIEKMIDNKIEKLEPHCEAPHCFHDIDGPGSIGIGKSAHFSWDPRFHPEGKAESFKLKAGTYRVSIHYQFRKSVDTKDWKWLQAYSNTFTID